jgi:hypothetical protein
MREVYGRAYRREKERRNSNNQVVIYENVSLD